MLDSGCCVPPDDGALLICDIEEVEEIDTPIGPPAGLNVEEEGSRPVGRSGSVSVLTSSSSSSSSSSILGQADWSSTRFRRSFRALSASCLEGKWGADGNQVTITNLGGNLQWKIAFINFTTWAV